MTRYAVGDLQGCYGDLRRLLDRIGFDPATDRLWFVGDLVNRGPASLATLRYVKGLGDAATVVLGNHDLHLLAIAWDAAEHRPHKGDNLEDVLRAPDRDELLDWLRRRPLLHEEDGWCMVHAGLPPQWDLETARACAREAEAVLAGDGIAEFIRHLYGNHPDRWSADLCGYDRWRFTINCLTRMRYCDADGRLEFQHKCAPGRQPAHLYPWYQVPGRKTAELKIVFGHWSTLGYRVEQNCWAIDTGCLWGGALTALRLDGPVEPIGVPCRGHARPG